MCPGSETKKVSAISCKIGRTNPARVDVNRVSYTALGLEQNLWSLNVKHGNLNRGTFLLYPPIIVANFPLCRGEARRILYPSIRVSHQQISPESLWRCGLLCASVSLRGMSVGIVT